MQLFRRIPKRGFSHATWDKYFLVVNVGDLDAALQGRRRRSTAKR